MCVVNRLLCRGYPRRRNILRKRRIGSVFHRQSYMRFCLFGFEVLPGADRMQRRYRLWRRWRAVRFTNVPLTTLIVAAVGVRLAHAAELGRSMTTASWRSPCARAATSTCAAVRPRQICALTERLIEALSIPRRASAARGSMKSGAQGRTTPSKLNQ